MSFAAGDVLVLRRDPRWRIRVTRVDANGNVSCERIRKDGLRDRRYLVMGSWSAAPLDPSEWTTEERK